jgi:hypothetical protein
MICYQTPSYFSKVWCRSRYAPSEDDGSGFFGTAYKYFLGKYSVRVALFIESWHRFSELMPELHALMKAHAGGA